MCMYALTKKQRLAAGLWGALAAASRLIGVLLIVPVIWSAWQDWRHEHNWKSWIAPALIALSGISFPLYVWLGMGLSPLAPFLAQSSRFHGGFTFPGVSILLTIKQIWSGIYVTANSMDLFFTILFILRNNSRLAATAAHLWNILCGVHVGLSRSLRRHLSTSQHGALRVGVVPGVHHFAVD